MNKSLYCHFSINNQENFKHESRRTVYDESQVYCTNNNVFLRLYRILCKNSHTVDRKVFIIVFMRCIHRIIENKIVCNVDARKHLCLPVCDKNLNKLKETSGITQSTKNVM